MANKTQPKKVKKYEPKKYTKQELEAMEAKKEKIIKLSIKIFAIVALVAVVAGIVIGVVVSVQKKTTTFNYMEEDLSKYITVDMDKLSDGFDVKNSTVDAVTEETLRNEILKLLNMYKPEALDNMRYPNVPVVPGDSVELFYRGYTVDDDGNKYDFVGGSNLLPIASDSNLTDDKYQLYSTSFADYKNYVSLTPLVIGSGNFIAGFELGIVDAFYSKDGVWNEKDISSFQKYLGYEENNKTVVEAGDYISISYTKHTDGSDVIVTENIDLASTELDGKLGLTGAASYFVGKKVNEEFTIVGAILDGAAVQYQNVKVTKVYNKTTNADLIELTYYANGTTTKTTVMVDLANTNLDKTYGAGFRALLINQPVGTVIKDNFRAKIEGSDTDQLYSDIQITRVLKFDDKAPLTISVKFPSNYGSTELAGKEAKFDIYAYFVTKYYDVENDGFPTLDDDFVTNEMKVKEEEVAEYEGASISEKYKAKIMANLTDEYNEKINELIQTRLWEVLREISTVKKLPKIDVQYYYDMYYTQLYSQYQQYQQYYGTAYTFEMFAEAQGLKTSTTTWQDALTKQAEQTVTEKLAFYYIIKEKNLIPDAQTEAALCQEFRDENLEAYLESSGYIEEDDEDGSIYASLKEEFDSMYTDAIVLENVQFEYAVEKLYAYANVISE